MSVGRRKAAIVGVGVIGGGWASRFLLNGWDVSIFDLDLDARRKFEEVLAHARRSLPSLYDKAMPLEGSVSFHEDIGEAVRGSLWVQESVPECLEVKHKVYAEIEKHAPEDAVIGSSTSGFKPSDLNVAGGRVIVAHPFNPVYLLPLVELVGDEEMCGQASLYLREMGMYPLKVRKEIDAHIADRLLESVWREGLWLVKEGVCTTGELDEAIRLGFGLRWGQMGLFETYRIAGGEAGMRHFMEQFGPALKWPWSRLTDVPELTDSLVDLIGLQSDAQSGSMTIRELERLRDDNLVGMMRSLKRLRSGVGATIALHESTFEGVEEEGLPVTVRRQVPQVWTDYNGHMNEARYTEVCAQATDRFMELIGCDEDYVGSVGSYFTVESHVRFLSEVREGEMITVRTRVLGGGGKRMHLFHSLYGGSGRLSCTFETLLLHVNLDARHTSNPSAAVSKKILEYAESHAILGMPEGVGSIIGGGEGM